MVAESRKGETFILGASTWRIEDITRDRVIVSPAPGEPGKMPFWRADRPGRSIELGVALGAFCRELDAQLARGEDAAVAWLVAHHPLDELAARNLARYVGEQRAATGAVPSDRAITIERFRDELGDERACILTPFGSRVHAPWALEIASRLERRLGYPVHPLWTDDGIALRFAAADQVPADDELLPDPDDLERTLVDELARSSLFASHFRENAARALLLPRRRPGQRTPLWAQRLRAQQLMGVALAHPAFPITLETYRELLRDVFDVPSLVELARAIRAGTLRVEPARTATPSPFARSLVFDYVAAFLYEGDAPIAERKAHALTLDRELLRELVGGGELRDLLDLDVLAEVEAELQRTDEQRRARDRDELHDLLRELGDLSLVELSARASPELDIAHAVDELVVARRAMRIELAGEARIIDADDVARYSELGGDGLVALIQRYARTHAPFALDTLAGRWGLRAALLSPLVQLLEARGLLARGELRPGSAREDLCDADVLRRLRRRTLAKLRAQIAPVPAVRYAELLPRWHGLDTPRRGVGALRDAIVRLEGVALPFAELEARLLPARVLDYHPRMLDELGAAGELVWIGTGALGAKDGRVLLARRDRARALAPPPQAIAHAGALHAAITAHLATAGASFLVALESALRALHTEVVAALWDLVWAGVVTNDTFAPLRARGVAPRRRTAAHAALSGRWALVSALGADPPPTACAHARATALLDRWAIANRGAARTDDVPGGFAALEPVLRAMEDAGALRRGLFVDGLDGVQYAYAAAIDRLREPGVRSRSQTPSSPVAPRVDVLAAIDPANAWGAALPWPPLRDPASRPARRVSASVVLVDGALALWIEPRARRIATAELSSDVVELALSVGVPALASRTRRRELLIEVIDGEPAARSPWQTALARVGARADYRGLVVRAATQFAPGADDRPAADAR
jgi:ATP-dependent Lhr-like helicase